MFIEVQEKDGNGKRLLIMVDHIISILDEGHGVTQIVVTRGIGRGDKGGFRVNSTFDEIVNDLREASGSKLSKNMSKAYRSYNEQRARVLGFIKEHIG